MILDIRHFLKIIIHYTKFHNELTFLKDIFFFKNVYPTSFIDKCFKTFLNKMYLKGSQILIVEKEHLSLVRPFLGKLSLQTRTKLHKALTRVLGCCKTNILFKGQRNLSNVFRLKDRLPYDIVPKRQRHRYNSSYYYETSRHLHKVRSGKHIGISPLILSWRRVNFYQLSRRSRVTQLLFNLWSFFFLWLLWHFY